MIRTIVTSATYRQSSQSRPDLADRDPSNVWLARQNRLRLEAEVVRDVALAAGGLLNPTIGGPSVRPPQPPGISELTYAGSVKWVESTGRRPLPPRALHLVPADQPVPDADDLRRARLQRLRRPPRALEHAAPGADAAQRPGLRRMRAGPRPPDRRGVGLPTASRAGSASRSASAWPASPRSEELALLGRLWGDLRAPVPEPSPRPPRSWSARIERPAWTSPRPPPGWPSGGRS